MGQVYSFLGYGNTRGNSNQEALLLGENFTCKICLEVLHDPVQCQNNEHYYCRKCITKHLRNSEKCPLCMEQLTLETLRPPTRIVARVLSQLKKPCNSSATIGTEKNAVNEQIFIFGGGCDDEIGKSVEVFNWSTKQWTLIENCLFFKRENSFSFIYGMKIMICGGPNTERIEYLNPSESGYTSTLTSVSLPNNTRYNGLLHKDRILTFTRSVVETPLKSPGKSRTLLMEKEGRSKTAGVHCFGNNIYIVGGKESSMEKYDVAKNEMKTLPSLPYKVSNMATVAYKDNIIILGGQNESLGKALDDVVMFNVTKHEYKKMPSLLEGRCNCSAVIIKDVIVVMGGSKKVSESRLLDLKTVECFVIGGSKWQKLSDMNLARRGATACAYDISSSDNFVETIIFPFMTIVGLLGCIVYFCP